MLKNSNKEAQIVCESPSNTYLTCERMISGSKSVAKGMPEVLHIFQEYLTGNDLIENVTIVKE